MTTSSKVVTPVKTGVQHFCNMLKFLDSGFHRNDVFWAFSTFDEIIHNAAGEGAEGAKKGGCRHCACNSRNIRKIIEIRSIKRFTFEAPGGDQKRAKNIIGLILEIRVVTHSLHAMFHHSRRARP